MSEVPQLENGRVKPESQACPAEAVVCTRPGGPGCWAFLEKQLQLRSFADASLSYSFGVVLARGVLKPLRMIRKNKLTFSSDGLHLLFLKEVPSK